MRPRIAMPGTTLYFIHPLLNSSSISRVCPTIRSLSIILTFLFCLLTFSFFLLFHFFFAYLSHCWSYHVAFTSPILSHSVSFPLVQSHLVPRRKFQEDFLLFFCVNSQVPDSWNRIIYLVNSFLSLGEKINFQSGVFAKGFFNWTLGIVGDLALLFLENNRFMSFTLSPLVATSILTDNIRP